MSLDKAIKLIEQSKNYEAAVILEPLVLNGDFEAMSLLGVLLQLGAPDLAADGIRAEKLLLLAAENGCGVAAHNLASLYATGAPGLDPRPELCVTYLKLAKDLGFQVAPEELYE